MGRPAAKSHDIDDLYRLPDDGLKYELSRGYLVSEPPPGGRHGRVAMRVAAVLDAYVRKHRLGVVLICDAGFILSRDPDTVRAPDVAFVNRRRFLALEDETRLIPGPPDLAVEVLSPSDSGERIAAKVVDYMTAACPHVWLVDPQTSQVRIEGALVESAVVGASGFLTAPDIVPGLRIPVGELFDL